MLGKNRLLGYLLALVIAMFGLAYASVPLYNIFCKATGFGGTVKRVAVEDIETRVGSKRFTIRFNADTDPSLPWSFVPEQRYIKLLTGKTGLAFYRAENKSNRPLSGIAVYNVTPHKVAKYFSKVACFCFTKQTIAAGKKTIFPVTFIIDPTIEDDQEASEVQEITLSYTFLPYLGPEQELPGFLNTVERAKS